MNLSTDVIDISTILEIFGVVVVGVLSYSALISKVSKISSDLQKETTFLEDFMNKIENKMATDKLDCEHKLEKLNNILNNLIKENQQEVETKIEKISNTLSTFDERHTDKTTKEIEKILINVKDLEDIFLKKENNVDKRIANIGMELKRMDKVVTHVRYTLATVQKYDIKIIKNSLASLLKRK